MNVITGPKKELLLQESTDMKHFVSICRNNLNDIKLFSKLYPNPNLSDIYFGLLEFWVNQIEEAYQKRLLKQKFIHETVLKRYNFLGIPCTEIEDVVCAEFLEKENEGYKKQKRIYIGNQLVSGKFDRPFNYFGVEFNYMEHVVGISINEGSLEIVVKRIGVERNGKSCPWYSMKLYKGCDRTCTIEGSLNGTVNIDEILAAVKDEDLDKIINCDFNSFVKSPEAPKK